MTSSRAVDLEVTDRARGDLLGRFERTCLAQHLPGDP